MSTNNNFKEVELKLKNKAFLSFHQDGFLDLLMGWKIFDTGLFLYSHSMFYSIIGLLPIFFSKDSRPGLSCLVLDMPVFPPGGQPHVDHRKHRRDLLSCCDNFWINPERFARIYRTNCPCHFRDHFSNGAKFWIQPDPRLRHSCPPLFCCWAGTWLSITTHDYRSGRNTDGLWELDAGQIHPGQS